MAPFLLGAVIPFVFLILAGLAMLTWRRAPEIPDDVRLLLAPAAGMLPIGLGTFVLWVSGLQSFTPLLSVGLAAFVASRWRATWTALRSASRASWIVVGVMFVQTLVLSQHYAIYDRSTPPIDPIWMVSRATGVTPPDQLFAWHQAVHIEQRYRYGQAEFYGDFDLFDRPHLGGLLTFFFHVNSPYALSDPRASPLQYHRFHYESDGLAWYRALWWMLNSLYVLGTAALMRILLGPRAAVLATGLTLFSAQVLLSTGGLWVKFAAAYPLLCATMLVLLRVRSLLTGLLAAAAFHLHGSTLPFVGALCFFVLLRAWRERETVRAGSSTLLLVVLLVTPWFVVPRLLGSKLPLVQYYLYDAGVTEAQTVPKSVLRERFYASAPRHQIVLLPTYNALCSLFPLPLLAHLNDFQFRNAEHVSLRAIATAIEQSELRSIVGVAGVWAWPFVVVGAVRLLRKKSGLHWIAVAYFLPTLYMAFLYRKDDVFRNHIMMPYHFLALTAVCAALLTKPRRYLAWLLPLAWLELQLALFFGSGRFSVADALTPAQLGRSLVPFLAIQFLLALGVGLIWRELPRDAARSPADDGGILAIGDRSPLSLSRTLGLGAVTWSAATLAYALLLAVKPI